MNTEKDFSGFYQENKTLLKEYLETRFNILKLQGIRTISRTMSMVIIIFVVSILALFTMLFRFLHGGYLPKRGAISRDSQAQQAFFNIDDSGCPVKKAIIPNTLIRMFIRESARELHEPIICQSKIKNRTGKQILRLKLGRKKLKNPWIKISWGFQNVGAMAVNSVLHSDFIQSVVPAISGRTSLFD
jgi:hypothetical protein